MKTRNLFSFVLFTTTLLAVTACDGVQRDPLEKQGANAAVRPAVPANWQDTTKADTVSMDRMDTATNPSMDGKP